MQSYNQISNIILSDGKIMISASRSIKSQPENGDVMITARWNKSGEK